DEAKREAALRRIDGVHADVAVGAALGARAAADAVVLDDRDLAARNANDAVHAAEKADGVFAMAARGREKQVAHLQSAQDETARAVTAFARVDAVLASGAACLVD